MTGARYSAGLCYTSRMTTEERQARVARAQELLRDIRHIPLATVNPDGSPHLSPVFLAFDIELVGYWSSNTDAQHSVNIDLTGQVYLTIYDSREGHGGLFMQATAEALTEEEDIQTALTVLRKAKKDRHGDYGDAEEYAPGKPLALYGLRPERLWVNVSERDEQGRFVRDARTPVTVQEVLGDG